MTCGHCEMSVREEVGHLRGVAAVDVSAQSGILRVTGDGSFDDAEVVAAVGAAGYTAIRVG
ncbi:heavy metal transporter [Mycobacterium sp. 1245111.1]|nr:heavy metal transporter [Mycobacterium sp. 1245111.1]